MTANDDGAVLLDVDHGMCFSLNPLGSRIWTALSQGRSRSQIIHDLSIEFCDVECAQIAADVDEFLSELARRKLLAS
ncbi:MAG: PqqD family protein [Bryobacteraceae bacterium]